MRPINTHPYPPSVSPTRLEGMETAGLAGRDGSGRASPTRLEGMETKKLRQDELMVTLSTTRLEGMETKTRRLSRLSSASVSDPP